MFRLPSLAIAGAVAATSTLTGCSGLGAQDPASCVLDLYEKTVLVGSMSESEYYEEVPLCTPENEWPSYDDQRTELEQLIRAHDELVPYDCFSANGVLHRCIWKQGFMDDSPAGEFTVDLLSGEIAGSFHTGTSLWSYGQPKSSNTNRGPVLLEGQDPPPGCTGEIDFPCTPSYFSAYVPSYLYLTEDKQSEITATKQAEAEAAAERKAAFRQEAENRELEESQKLETCLTLGGDECEFREMDLTGHDFAGVRLTNARFHKTGLAGANFEGADLTNAKFGFGNADGANFREVTAEGVSMDFVSLEGADFTSAELTGANIQQIGPKTNFQGSNLTDSDLSASDWKRVNFTDANLSNAFVRIGGYHDGDYQKAIWENTTCPNGQVVSGGTICPGPEGSSSVLPRR